MQHLLKVSLRDVEPRVTREFVVPSDIRLDRLHDVLQRVMGWNDVHLHEYVVGGLRTGARFGPRDSEAEAYGQPSVDESNVALVEIAGRIGAKFFYQYDFGDDWLHDVVVKAIGDLEADPSVPRCLKAAGACPPEDCGGPTGYTDLLVALRDPEHEEHADMRLWVGGAFDPEAAYDYDAINAELARMASAWHRPASRRKGPRKGR